MKILLNCMPCVDVGRDRRWGCCVTVLKYLRWPFLNFLVTRMLYGLSRSALMVILQYWLKSDVIVTLPLLNRILDEFDAYIIVSFVNATLVLSIGETVEEVTDSGFLGTTPTLGCSSLGDNALLQVYPEGIRHIRADRRVNEWKSPGKRAISKCAVNQRQVVISLAGGELVYFEMDPVNSVISIVTNDTNLWFNRVQSCQLINLIFI